MQLENHVLKSIKDGVFSACLIKHRKHQSLYYLALEQELAWGLCAQGALKKLKQPVRAHPWKELISAEGQNGKHVFKFKLTKSKAYFHTDLWNT